MSSNEASITSVARLAAAKGDGDYAFALIKDLVANGGLPRLRTYSPALLYFCENLEDGKAYEVEEHMDRMNVSLEEAEMAALLKVSAEVGKEERVYRYLHKLRGSVRCVSKETAKIIENWFSGEKGSAVGNGVEYSATEIREAVSKNGGGWHGLGWVGRGKWVVRRANVEETGRCCCCGEQLACVDIDEIETEKFANSVAALAMEREAKLNFSDFQVREDHMYICV